MPHTSTKQECILWDDTQPRSKTNISKAEEYLKLLKAFLKGQGLVQSVSSESEFHFEISVLTECGINHVGSYEFS